MASSNEQFVGVNAAEQGAPFATDPPAFDGPDDTHVTDPFSVSVADHPIISVVSPERTQPPVELGALGPCQRGRVALDVLLQRRRRLDADDGPEGDDDDDGERERDAEPRCVATADKIRK